VGLSELQTAVARLSADELATFARWFGEFLADEWDRQIEADIKAGRLDEAGRRADADFEAGRYESLLAKSVDQEAARRRDEMRDPAIGLTHEEVWNRITARPTKSD
jgi:hypothetical protein